MAYMYDIYHGKQVLVYAGCKAEKLVLCVERVVCVTVVPARGDPLSPIKEDIEEHLLRHAMPGIHVKLKEYEPEYLHLSITLTVDKARFNPPDVEEEVRKALLQRFTLEKRSIAAPVYLSDVYQCVEAIRGVEYSVCKFINVVFNNRYVRVPEPEMENGKPTGEYVTNNDQIWETSPDGVLYATDDERSTIHIKVETQQ